MLLWFLLLLIGAHSFNITIIDDAGNRLTALNNGSVLNQAYSDFNLEASTNVTWTSLTLGMTTSTRFSSTPSQSFPLGSHTLHVEETSYSFDVIHQEFPVIWDVIEPFSKPTLGGFQITLIGDYFQTINCTSNPVVMLGTYLCALDFVNQTTIICTVPPGQGIHEIIVSNCGVRNAHLPRMTDFYVVNKDPGTTTKFKSPTRYCVRTPNPDEQWSYTWFDNWICINATRARVPMKWVIKPNSGYIYILISCE
jgi:hypothetical protein